MIATNGTTTTTTTELTIPQAVELARLLWIQRLHRIECELAELEIPPHLISPMDLALLEDAGLIVDFDRETVKREDGGSFPAIVDGTATRIPVVGTVEA